MASASAVERDLSLDSLSGTTPGANGLRRSDKGFDLGGGTFTFTTPDGDLSGTYAGHASSPLAGKPRTSLDLTVTGGTKSFRGAAGSLTGDGSGAFLGDGDFALALRGSISTPSGCV